jgi:outer membrane protein OmpA-like peptidoglycan-associated protein
MRESGSSLAVVATATREPDASPATVQSAGVSGVVSSANASAGPEASKAALLDGGIRFRIGSARLTGSARMQLRELARVLKTQPGGALAINGHADSRGGAWLNQRLSERRAAAVARFLLREGVPAERLQASGFGADKPIADNATEAGRQANRRVDLRMLA